MVNKSFIKKWVKALKSGEYGQGRFGLRNDTIELKRFTYCCLGVACDISGLGTWIDNNQFRMGDKIHSGTMPTALLVYIGLTHGEGNKLIALNDDKKYTFKQIAEYLEKAYLNTPEE